MEGACAIIKRVNTLKNNKYEIYAYLKAYIAQQGYGPAVREICEAVQLRSTATVHYHLHALEEEGLISMGEGKRRAISLTGRTPKDEAEESGKAAAAPGERENRIPLVGTVAAGQPILAEENVESWLPWEGAQGWFALRVKGESMKNAGILPGDKLIVRPQPTAENGEIVVALLGDEATVKRFSRKNGHIRLLPENEAFEPIDGDEAAILGVVRGVVREYE